MKWFRFYSEVVHDPKVQRLPDNLFRLWVNLLCLANENEDRGAVPSDMDELAWTLRTDTDTLRQQLHSLQGQKLLDWDEDTETFECHNFSERQRRSDDVTARVEKHRAKVKASETLHVTDVKQVGNVLEKSREEEEKRETREEKREIERAPAKSKAKSTSLPPDFVVTEDMQNWAIAKSMDYDVYLNVSLLAEKFITYYREGKGKGKPQIDWVATWHQWVLTECERGGHKNGQSQGVTGLSNGTAKARSTERALGEEAQYRARRQARGDYYEGEMGSRSSTT